MKQLFRSLSFAFLCLSSASAWPGGETSGNEGPVVEVSIYKMQFRPAEVTVKKGTTVRWINKEKRQYHSVWFEALGEEESDYLFPGDTYERTFDAPGDYPYRCGPHPEMTGVIRVTE